MKFSMLAWPTDAPDRIPLSRGLPSASAMAVDTSAMPRSLPMPNLNQIAPPPIDFARMDPGVAAAPYQALAKFAAVGGQFSESVGNLVMEAEARKRNADNLAVAGNLSYKASIAFDEAIEKAKGSTDSFTFKSTVDTAWKQISQDTMAEAHNPAVARELGLKLTGLQAHKYPEINNAQRQKQASFYEASLVTSSLAATRLITDPASTDVERDYQIKNIESLYFGYGKQGLLPLDKIISLRERTLTPAFNTLAQQAMTRDPEQFMPKSKDNPNGGDGYRQFAADGKYPADPKYLNQLIDVTAPAKILASERLKAEEERRTQSWMDANMTGAWQQNFKQLLTDFYSDDPTKVASASARVDAFIFEAGAYAKNGEVETILRARRDTARNGGVTIPDVYAKIQTEVLRDPASVSREYILSWGGRGLAVTGEQSMTALLDKREQLLQGTDVSQKPDYKIGMRIIEASPLGQSSVLSAAAAFNPSIKIGDVRHHGDMHSKAIAEFDRLARSKEWEGKSLRELGEFLTDKYTKLLYQRGTSERPKERP